MNHSSPPSASDLTDFRTTFFYDLRSGFVVFLLALPLSLGIATASGFPPLMGVVTAIIGGIFGGFLSGSPLSIKGPAAGLIVILAGCVEAFGGGVTGWQITLGVVVVAGIFQLIFGVLKWGRFVDLFPLSAIHGMLAAIGLIIIAKQIPVMLNVDPVHTAGKGPIELFKELPQIIAHADMKVGAIGIISFIIAMFWSRINHPVHKSVPAPLLVLIVAIPYSIIMELDKEAAEYTLVKIGSVYGQIGFNASFDPQGEWGTFIKFVLMICIVGSLESLLTVKAIDLLDPWKRKSNSNKDLVAVGAANTLCGLVGGLPMISEVARSSANIVQGGRSRWANIFHGLFLLISVVVMVPLIELIPNSALAALLIAVGIKLAHPSEFIHMKKVGLEQLAIFLCTIFFTLDHDLLFGIGAGMLLKFIIHLFRGMPIKSAFKAGLTTQESDDKTITVKFGKAAVFTNYISIRDLLRKIPEGKRIVLDLENTVLLDHSVMSNLETFCIDYAQTGGEVIYEHLDSMTPVSQYPTSSRRRKKSK